MSRLLRIAQRLYQLAQVPSWPVIAYTTVFILTISVSLLWVQHDEIAELRRKIAIFDKSNQGLMVAYATEKARKPKILLVKPADPVIAEIPPEKVEYTGVKQTPPLAFRNKNPLNVKQPSRSMRWKGQIGVDHIGHAQFASWEDGFRASALVLKNYVTRHRISTIKGLVCRFAEGNQEEYMIFLEKRLKVKRDEQIDILKRLPEILRAMAKFESGHDFPDRYFTPYDVVKYLATSGKEERS